MPKVSVLIPSYNYARFLPAAIESVLGQDFADFELIISDDGSTDDSPAVIRRYAARDRRIRVHLAGINAGMVANWNWCLRQARGELVKFVFADDCLAYRHSLARLVSHLEANPAAVLTVSARLVLDEASRPHEVWNELRPPGLQRGPGVIARCLARDKNLIGEPSAALFRRAAARRGFDPLLRQLVDLEFWFHLLLAGDLFFDPEPLCAFRTHPAQQTQKNRAAHTGPVESLHLAGRYLDAAFGDAPRRLGAWRKRRILHRTLHYSRKRAPRIPDILAAESALAARLSRSWLLTCWAVHRVIKPFDNLTRQCRRLARKHRPAVIPDSLKAWSPPDAWFAAGAPGAGRFPHGEPVQPPPAAAISA